MEKYFENFELDINDAGDTGFRIECRGPGGEGGEPLSPPFNPREMEDWMGHWQPLSKQPASDSGDFSIRSLTPEEMGGHLFRALLPGRVGLAYTRALSACRENHKGLRLVLRFNVKSGNHVEISRIPWELIRDPDSPVFLTLQKHLSLVRYLEQPLKMSRPPLPAPIHMLVVAASPSGLPSFDKKAFADTLRESIDPNLIHLTFLAKPTLMELCEFLCDHPCHVLTFIGHGGRNQQHQWGLAFEGDRGEEHFVTGAQLATALQGTDSLRLVNLVSCELARNDRQERYSPFSGVAYALTASEIPAVLAMQFPISIPDAHLYLDTLFRRLAKGDPLDTALDETRRRLNLNSPQGIGWSSPVLFLRSDDSRLFTKPELQRIYINSVLPKITPNMARDLAGQGNTVFDFSHFFEPGTRERSRRVRSPGAWAEILAEIQEHKEAMVDHVPVKFSGKSWLSIWLAVGYVFRQATGFKLSIQQENYKTQALETWSPVPEPQPIEIEKPWQAQPGSQADEMVVSLSISRGCQDQVGAYIKEQPELAALPWLKLDLGPQTSRTSLSDNTMANRVTHSMVEAIQDRFSRGNFRRIHLFLAAPAAAALFIGRELAACGQIQVYEFQNPGYTPAFLLE